MHNSCVEIDVDSIRHGAIHSWTRLNQHSDYIIAILLRLLLKFIESKGLRKNK